MNRTRWAVWCTAACASLAGAGDAIVVCGQKFSTGGAPVVLWSDPGGYDAYKLDPALPAQKNKAGEALDPHRKRYDLRKGLNADSDLAALRESVDQFVLHFDVCGISKTCFKVLHENRGLSVHFMLDLDGTIYQTLDLRERAWHATIANHRSIGVEIAHIGAYSVKAPTDPLADWYKTDPAGEVFITIPKRFGDPKFRTPNFKPRPRKPQPIVGEIQGKQLRQYDYTPEQYASLVRLTATLCRVFPNLTCDYPKDAAGKLAPRKLDDADYARYRGVLGHYHVQLNKTDPGPALDWDHVVGEARKLNAKPANP